MKKIKLLIATIVLSMTAITGFGLTAPKTSATRDDFDAATFFKAKCAMCHGQKAEKKFDASLPDEELVQIVLKGKEGTPKMPEYGSKGIDAEKAAALIAHMKSLKQ